MKAMPALPTLIATLLIAFSSTSDAADHSSSSVAKSASSSASASKKIDRDETSSEDPELRAQGQNRKMELAKLADDKRKADEARKQADIERLAKEAGEDRQQEALRKAEDKKRKEQLRQQAAVRPRCLLKPIMSDAEIARCR